MPCAQLNSRTPVRFWCYLILHSEFSNFSPSKCQNLPDFLKSLAEAEFGLSCHGGCAASGTSLTVDLENTQRYQRIKGNAVQLGFGKINRTKKKKASKSGKKEFARQRSVTVVSELCHMHVLGFRAAMEYMGCSTAPRGTCESCQHS